MKRIIFLILYYGCFRYLPPSYYPFIGKISMKLRYVCVKNIFKFCGKNVNVEYMASFGRGDSVVIGNNSGIGINCTVPPDIIIGKNVMMGPNCYFFATNHRFDRIDVPMIQQGYIKPSRKFIIEDDVWLGRGCMVLPGRTIKKGSIIAAGCILTKDFPAYSVIGGNPGKIIKCRC